MTNDLVLLMEKNLSQVWGERDASSRLESIRAIYTADCKLYHVGHQLTGHEAINESVSIILENMPLKFAFFKLKAVVINNDIGRLVWGMGEDEQSISSTGMDIAVFEDGKIKALYVFVD